MIKRKIKSEVKNIKKAIKFVFTICLIFSITAFSAIVYCDATYPQSIYSATNKKIKINPFCSILSDSQTDSSVMTVMGILPVKDVTVSTAPTDSVVVCGTPFGVMLYSRGVMVVGSAAVNTKKGLINPAAQSGIRVGDIIISIDGVAVNSIEDVTRVIKNSQGQSLNFLCTRDSKEFTASVAPVMSSDDGAYHIGLWVRDSSAGIGTMTFYCPALSVGVGFGHPVCDADTGQVIPLSQGTAVNATVYSYRKGAAGNPGELLGALKIRSVLGKVITNTDNGVYFECDYQPDGVVMPIAGWNEAQTGTAKIYTTINGQTPCYYDVRIDKINANSHTKNLELTVIDKDLIEQTGGILQGMSGSPIIQNGKLVGAVTHVLLDDSAQGYGIFAENMLETARFLTPEQLKDAS